MEVFDGLYFGGYKNDPMPNPPNLNVEEEAQIAFFVNGTMCDHCQEKGGMFFRPMFESRICFWV